MPDTDPTRDPAEARPRTSPEARAARAARREERRRAKRRQNLTLAIGGGLGVVVVVGVLLSTLSSGGGSTPEPTQPPTATSAPRAFSDIDVNITPPPGDYTQLCKRFAPDLVKLDGDPSFEQIRQLYSSVDFGALAEVAPEGLRPSIETVRDDREQVMNALDQVDEIDQLRDADLPEGFAQALVNVLVSVADRCLGIAPAGATTTAG